MNRFKRGVGYQLKKFADIWFFQPAKCLCGNCCYIVESIATFVSALVTVGFENIDLFKDITLVAVLLHISQFILVSMILVLKSSYLFQQGSVKILCSSA